MFVFWSYIVRLYLASSFNTRLHLSFTFAALILLQLSSWTREAIPLIVRTDSQKSYASSQKSDQRSNYSSQNVHSHCGSQRSNNLSNNSNRSKRSHHSTGSQNKLVHSGSYSPTKTLASDVEKLSFDSDSEVYDVPALHNNQNRSKLSQHSCNESKSVLTRVDSKKSSKWGYGWGLGEVKEREREMLERLPSVDSERPSLYKTPTCLLERLF